MDRSPYRYTAFDHAEPNATARVGLLWTDSRPSDDRVRYNYNIPDNMFAVVALTKAAEIARAVFNDTALAAAAVRLRDSVDAAICTHGVFPGNRTVPAMYAFEVDGFGGQLLMDDANMPNLLSIPYMEYDPSTCRRGGVGGGVLYANTRAFSLRARHPMTGGCTEGPDDAKCHGNPYYYEGGIARGLGSSHQSHGLRPVHKGPQCTKGMECIWPLGLIMEAMTASDVEREREILCVLLRTDDGQMLMHEGFNKDNSTFYDRDLFGWGNALFSEWLLQSAAFAPADNASTHYPYLCPPAPLPRPPPPPPPPAPRPWMYRCVNDTCKGGNWSGFSEAVCGQGCGPV